MEQTDKRPHLATAHRHAGHPLGPRGFSLTEVVATLAIVAILAAIAIPSYQAQIRQGRRVDGQTALLDIAIAQERFRANCTRFAAALAGQRACDTASATFVLGIPATSTDGHYTLALSGVDSSGFTASATALGDQADDRAGGVSCATLTIDQDGRRSPVPCW